jgi:rhamnose utilization protein RhaD (predicted bifunctional aldolase and dehydrogenase)
VYSQIELLLELSHQLGREERQLAILGEGNTSARLDADTFAVKASGSNLATLGNDNVTRCRFDLLSPLLEQTGLDDAAIDAGLLRAQLEPHAKKPSVEALFHAYLLTLPGVEFVGHTHPVTVNQILCSGRAREFAENRLFPDEIVCCGPASVFVPYTDPGLRLAQAIRAATDEFMHRHECRPSVILLENHGVITLGRTSHGVLAAMLMTEKSARIWVGAAVLGGPQYLSVEQIARIAGRPDEHHRQRMLNI